MNKKITETRKSAQQVIEITAPRTSQNSKNKTKWPEQVIKITVH